MQRGALSRLLFAVGLPGFPRARACAVSGLKLPLPSIVKGSPDIARALYRGQYTLAGVTVDSAHSSVLTAAAPSEGWAEALHSFDWLAHTAAQNAALDRVFARNLVMEWQARRRPAIGMRTAPRRLINLVKYAPFLLEGGGAQFEAAFYAALEESIAIAARPAAGVADLVPSLALAYAAVGLRGAEKYLPQALTRLETALESAVLPDGSEASRNPQRHLALLLDLLPLRAGMAVQRIPIPQPVNAVIERMIPMLRFFTLGDGGLALFHGASQPMTAEAKAALDQDSAFGRPFVHAPYAGFLRLAHGKAAVIMDCGTGGPHDSALAFEMSDGAHRLIVNCGSPAEGASGWTVDAACASAHSACDCGDAGKALTCEARQSAGEEGTMGSARLTREHLMHERDIYLAQSGHDLRGEDRIAASSVKPFTLRFHLHPAVKATLARGSEAVMLQLPDKTGWRFTARGAAMALEESVFFGTASGPRRTSQIVLSGTTQENPRVKWALKRIEKKEKGATPGQTMTLPF